VLQSACGWVRDFHIDGLRLDAVHAIHDESPTHIVAELVTRVHATNPATIVIAESGLNDPRVIRGAQEGGWGCDAQWADEFHHALHVLLTGERDGYYADFGAVADLAKAFRRPFVFDGQYSPVRRRCFGAPADDRPPVQFVVFDQNHDQVGNRAFGERLAPGARALAAFCTLLSPFTPMLFMGEEWGADTPWQYFTDHIDPGLAKAVAEGRKAEFAEHGWAAADVPDPQDEATFLRSKLDWAQLDREPYLGILAWYRELIALRRARPELTDPRLDRVSADFDEDARWIMVRRGRLRIAANLGREPVRLALGQTGTGVLAASSPGVAIQQDTVTLPSAAFAVIETRAPGARGA
jgi:maltooligosyltrehalose trehalohydrolase